MRKLLLGIAPFVFALSISGSAQAQTTPQCNERGVVIELLSEKYGEIPSSIGVANSGGLIEVLTSVDGTTWSIIITSPKGMACLVAAGEGWKNLDSSTIDRDPIILDNGSYFLPNKGQKIGFFN